MDGSRPTRRSCRRPSRARRCVSATPSAPATTTNAPTAAIEVPPSPTSRLATHSPTTVAPTGMFTAVNAIAARTTAACRRRFTYRTVSEMRSNTTVARPTRAERQAQPRQALIDAAAEVVLERGYSGASVEAIAARAGYTRGAFYANFRSKQELFVEVLRQRVASVYTRLAEDVAASPGAASPQDVAARLAGMQADPEGAWLFRLWLEVLAHAAREPSLTEVVAGFWSTTRAASAQAIAAWAAAEGTELTAPAEVLATLSIAVDIGLAVQHFVDPEAVPLDLYEPAFAVLYRGGRR